MGQTALSFLELIGRQCRLMQLSLSLYETAAKALTGSQGTCTACLFVACSK